MANPVTREMLKNATEAAAAEAKGSGSTTPPANNSAYTAPGRLGNPKNELKDETTRMNAKLATTAAAFGMNRNTPLPRLSDLNENSSIEDVAKLVEDAENMLIGFYNSPMPMDTPEDVNEPEIERSEEVISGGGGHDMKIYIYRPKDQKEDLPGVLYIHGGAMVMAPTMNPIHDRWCKSIAIHGCVVAMVDFRNVFNRTGKYDHYPAGLDDCVAAVKWLSENKSKLRMKNLVLEGESGGGNLVLATALRAKREGWVDQIAGVYAMVPYISNAYGWSEEQKLKELPSLVENHGYLLNVHANAFLGHFYTPNDKDATNPLAWPYHATVEDMKGLPPHIMSMDELDPLRDEGVSYARRLVQAGVRCKGSVNLGVVHGTSLTFRNLLPELHQGATREIAAFAKSL